MARSGISKFHVKQARDALMAQGQHPSLDAIRTAMGNTGSKSTIHRYMRELEEEEGTRLDDHALLSNTLKDIVGRLATQLHSEAREIVARHEADHQLQLKSLRERLADIEKTAQKCTADSTLHQADLEKERAQHQLTTAAFHTEQLRAHRLEQEVQGLNSQLKTAEKHQLSLEEKHQHAREALEHFRAAAKEQREQEQRRHEQQLQQIQAELRQLQQTLIIKQSEVTEITKDNARLAAELSETRKQAAQLDRDNREKVSLLAHEKEKLFLLEQRFADSNVQIEGLKDTSESWQARLDNEVAKRVEIQKDHDALLAKLEAQTMIIDSFKVHLQGSMGTTKNQ